VNKVRHFLDKYGLWGASILISLSFASLDGRYLRSYMFDGWLGTICAYTGNFLIDLSSEFLIYEFTRHQRDTIEGKARNRKRGISWILLIGAMGLLYFALIFSFRQASLIKANEPLIYRWSIAAFAQVALLLLGIASALRDYPAQKEKTSKPKAERPRYVCDVCGYVAKNSNALSGHKRWCSSGNGRHPHPERVEAGEEQR
jgi:hypothetical protein